MELLLNLCWLMLALPAYWLWRLEKESGQSAGRFGSWRCVLVLGCMLVLLFPVVSATDDLHVMRPEMEEPGPSKRTLKNLAQARALSGIPTHSQATVMSGPPAVPFSPDLRVCGRVCVEPPVQARAAAFFSRSGRAPPSPLLG